MGREDLGRISAGAKADLTSIDVGGFLVGPGMAPPEPLNNLLYASGLSVRHVFVDGRQKIREGNLTVEDGAAVAAAGARVVQKIWRQLESEKWFGPS